jgi:CHAT domain-containing protein
VKPVLDAGVIPQGVKSLIIVPDGSLAYLPFDVLRPNKDAPDLGEVYRLSLSPSVSVSVLAGRTAVNDETSLLAFGGALYSENPGENRYARGEWGSRGSLTRDFKVVQGKGRGEKQTNAVDFYKGCWPYLPGTVDEVRGLADLTYTSDPLVIEGAAASEKRVKTLSANGTLAQYPFVHFACHGFFNEYVTPEAGVVLSEVSGLVNDSSDDGYLSIGEIVLLKLRANMVMLSACETGLGEVKRGDGMVGLARAFLISGAKNVGVSLWKIDDAATSAFMTSVYKKVIEAKLSFREAYYQTKQEFRHDNKYFKWRHPYFWAAFALYE